MFYICVISLKKIYYPMFSLKRKIFRFIYAINRIVLNNQINMSETKINMYICINNKINIYEIFILFE